jgi:hypothetical protein
MHLRSWLAATALTIAGAALAQEAPQPMPPSTAKAIAVALVARGDTMIFAGRLFGAESAYYAAVKVAPHDGPARLALGKYLAGRGALPFAAALMEEARHFGSDPHAVAVEIAPVYARLGVVADSLADRANAWAARAALPSSAVPLGERLRAEYLKSHLPVIKGADSGVAVYAVSDSHLLGRIRIDVAKDSVSAIIDARVSGLVLDTSWMRRDSVRRFAPRGVEDPAQTYGVVSRVKIGAIVFENVPVRFQPLKGATNALIGLDTFGALAATFDPRVGYVLMRKDGHVKGLGGWKIPTYVARTGVLVVKGETMFPIGHPDVQQYFRVGKWTWDARHGIVVVDSVGVARDSAAPPPT